MKVKIVEKKEPKDEVVEMTIEELARKKFVGLDAGIHGKFLLSKGDFDGWSFINPDYSFGFLGAGRNKTPLDKIKNAACEGHYFYVFDDEKEPGKALFLWMAE